MDTYYSLGSKEKCILGVYTGCDPNLKYQKCFILGESESSDKFKVKFKNDYLGDFETYLNKADIFLT